MPRHVPKKTTDQGTAKKTRLIQTVVRTPVLLRLDALVRATGHTRASYLRHLVEMHVDALDPRLARALTPKAIK
jgi:predicted DNA-binding protein